jgi:molybdenum cofactor guanylyltransferase
MNNLLGVVMCGGESSRMGKDKGLLQKNGVAWAQIVSYVFQSLNIPFVLSVNPAQQKDYSKIFESKILIPDNNLPVKGPLKGLLSIHTTQPDKNLFLIACDMIEMEIATVGGLLKIYTSDRQFDFYGYQADNIIEPFCGIYSSVLLKEVIHKVQNSTLEHYSLQNVIRSGKQMILPVHDHKSFNNYNTPESLH